MTNFSKGKEKLHDCVNDNQLLVYFHLYVHIIGNHTKGYYERLSKLILKKTYINYPGA